MSKYTSKLISELRGFDHSTIQNAHQRVGRGDFILSLIFEVGVAGESFTEEQQKVIGKLLSQELPSIKSSISYTDCKFKTCFEPWWLEQRSALQFLIKDYAQFPVDGKKLKDNFNKVDLKASVARLDEVISKWKDILEEDIHSHAEGHIEEFIRPKVPVVGHVKAGFHQLAGDTAGADKAFRQSTRATAVLAGGITGGPLGAIAAGAAADVVMSVASDEPQGIIRGASRMAEDISRGEIPVMSTIETVLTPACDAIGGQAAGNVLNSAVKMSAKSAVKQAATKEVVEIAQNAAISTVPYVCEKVLDERNRASKRRNNRSPPSKPPPNPPFNPSSNPPPKPSTAESSSSSGGGPPNNPPTRKPTTGTKTQEDIVKEILDILKNFFPNIGSHGINRLRLLINTIIDSGFDVRIIAIALYLTNTLNIDEDVMIFSSLAEFVMVYIGEQALELQERSSEHFNSSGEELREIIVTNLLNSYNLGPILIKFEKYINKISMKIKYGEPPTLNDLLNLINGLLRGINNDCRHSRFRDIYSALYHYYKHRKVVSKRTGVLKILTISEYFKLIEEIYLEVQDTYKYKQMKKTKSGEEADPALRVYEIIHVSKFEIHGRHFKLVIKLQNGRIVVASCHWITYTKTLK